MKVTLEERERRFHSRGELYCCHCQRWRKTNKFQQRNRERNHGYKYTCKDCVKHQNQETWRDNNELAWLVAIELLGYNSCQSCGKTYEMGGSGCLHLHHIDPATKKFVIMQRYTNKSVAKAPVEFIEEVDKCTLLCADCHGSYHAGMLELKFQKQENNLGFEVVK